MGVKRNVMNRSPPVRRSLCAGFFVRVLCKIVRGCAGRPVCCLKRLGCAARAPRGPVSRAAKYVSHTAASATSRLVPLSTHTYRGRGAWERGRGRAARGARAQQRVGWGRRRGGGGGGGGGGSARRARRRGGAATAAAVAAPSVPETRALRRCTERASGKGGQAWRRGTRGGGGEQPSAP